MRISDWSSDVCSSDLDDVSGGGGHGGSGSGGSPESNVVASSPSCEAGVGWVEGCVGCHAGLAKSRTLTLRFAPPSPAAQERGFGSRGPRALSRCAGEGLSPRLFGQLVPQERVVQRPQDRKSTRLNSSHYFAT